MGWGQCRHLHLCQRFPDNSHCGSTSSRQRQAFTNNPSSVATHSCVRIAKRRQNVRLTRAIAGHQCDRTRFMPNKPLCNSTKDAQFHLAQKPPQPRLLNADFQNCRFVCPLPYAETPVLVSEPASTTPFAAATLFLLESPPESVKASPFTPSASSPDHDEVSVKRMATNNKSGLSIVLSSIPCGFESSINEFTPHSALEKPQRPRNQR